MFPVLSKLISRSRNAMEVASGSDDPRIVRLPSVSESKILVCSDNPVPSPDEGSDAEPSIQNVDINPPTSSAVVQSRFVEMLSSVDGHDVEMYSLPDSVAHLVERTSDHVPVSQKPSAKRLTRIVKRFGYTKLSRCIRARFLKKKKPTAPGVASVCESAGGRQGSRYLFVKQGAKKVVAFFSRGRAAASSSLAALPAVQSSTPSIVTLVRSAAVLPSPPPAETIITVATTPASSPHVNTLAGPDARQDTSPSTLPAIPNASLVANPDSSQPFNPVITLATVSATDLSSNVLGEILPAPIEIIVTPPTPPTSHDHEMSNLMPCEFDETRLSPFLPQQGFGVVMLGKRGLSLAYDDGDFDYENDDDDGFEDDEYGYDDEDDDDLKDDDNGPHQRSSFYASPNHSQISLVDFPLDDDSDSLGSNVSTDSTDSSLDAVDLDHGAVSSSTSIENKAEGEGASDDRCQDGLHKLMLLADVACAVEDSSHCGDFDALGLHMSDESLST